jgi:hypothetical protein
VRERVELGSDGWSPEAQSPRRVPAAGSHDRAGSGNGRRISPRASQAELPQMDTSGAGTLGDRARGVTACAMSPTYVACSSRACPVVWLLGWLMV